MSIILQEDELKGLPDDYLAREMEKPSGQYPQFLVFTELNRRKDLRERFVEQQAQAPTSTMAEEMVAEFSGIGQAMPPQMMPPMDMAMQGVPEGGIRGFRDGGPLERLRRSPYFPELQGTLPRELTEFEASQFLSAPKEQWESIATSIFGTKSRPSLPADSVMRGGAIEYLPISEPRVQALLRDEQIAEGTYFTPDVDRLEEVDGQKGDQSATQAGLLPFANQQSTPTFKERIDEVMSAFGPAPEPEYSDLDRFEAMFEELNPAPDPNVTRGRALMAIGQGLLGAPTFAEGLSAGAGGVGKIYGEDAAAQREYNKNRLAAKQALMETRDARAEFAANRDFQGRTSALRAAAQMYGDDVTAALSARSGQASLMQDELETLIGKVEFLRGDEKKAALERIQFLRNRLNSMFGPRVTRDLVVTPTP
jgi:hypothetical protein